MKTRLYIIGAGLAGLSAAVEGARRGHRVTVIEAAPHAGGRCRTFVHPGLGRLIDNGSHLVVGANTHVFDFLSTVDAPDGLSEVRDGYSFLDLETGRRWRVKFGLPLIWAAMRRRLPFTLRGLLRGAHKLAAARHDQTVGDVLGGDPAFRVLWEPLAVSVLNTPARDGSARLLGAGLERIVQGGVAAGRPYVAPHGLGPALIDPALDFLRANGVEISFAERVSALTMSDGAVAEITTTKRTIPLSRHESVVLAVPPGVATDLVPSLTAPTRHHAIVNAHFRVSEPIDGPVMLGLIGGTAEWLFRHDDIIAVTVSAADGLAARDDAAIAATLWADVAKALGLDASAMPPVAVIRERRATIAQTPDTLPLRPPTRGPWANLFLAGDWIATDLPCTIEGAILSGRDAALSAIRAPA